MRSLEYPGSAPILQLAMGHHRYTPAQVNALRRELARAGFLNLSSRPVRMPLLHKAPALVQPPAVHDPVRQTGLPRSQTKAFGVYAFTAPAVNFDGLAAGYVGAVVPPDTDIAVGLSRVVEEVNGVEDDSYGSFFRVFDKSGNPLTNAVFLPALWAGLSSICEDSTYGDGVVVYDQLAERWVISQLAGGSYPTDECIAVSETADPAGAYYLYDFPVFPNMFADYPKLAVWPDAYYASFNVFRYDGSAFLGEGFVAFERDAMLAGSPHAQMLVFQGNGNDLAYSALPASLDGADPPPAGAPGIFLDYVSPALWGSGVPYALEMWQMHVDWTTPSDSTLSGPTQIAVAPFNDELCGGAENCIPEPSPGGSLDAISDRLMFRLAYRGGVGSDAHQALVVNQTVGISGASPPSGIRWYELDAPAGDTNPSDWTLAQQGTFAPNDGNNRWMGSIAMDRNGDMALGYSVAGPSLDPSVAYVGRLAGDPAGQMTQAETWLVTGGGVQEDLLYPDYRWGDYSSMVLDPSDDCTFWYAQEYYATTGDYDWSTRIGAFQFSGCSAPATGTLTGQVSDVASGSALAGAVITLSPGDRSAVSDQNGNFAVADLPAGSYTATASRFGYQAQTQTVTVTQSQTSSQDFALTAESGITLSGSVSDAGHGYGLYAEVRVITPTFGQVAEVWTDPRTGRYSISVPAGFDYQLAVNAYLAGFNPASMTLTDVVTDTTQDFALTADASCAAPGYYDAFGTDFNEGFPPAGWTVTNEVAGSPLVWHTDNYWTDPNFTGASGAAAAVDVANGQILFGYNGLFDTALVSPPIPVSSLPPAPMLQFALNYQSSGATDALDVDMRSSANGTWTNLAHITGAYGHSFTPPGTTYDVPLSIPAGATDVWLRWRYYDLGGPYGIYAQIDNVEVGTCLPAPGGLVVGRVTHVSGGGGVVGAMITDNNAPPEHATSIQNLAADPVTPTGYYFLFANTTHGTNLVLTASSADLSPVSAAVTVAPGTITEQDFALGDAEFSGSPTDFDLHVMVNNRVTQTFTVSNTGDGSGRMRLLPFDTSPPNASAAAARELPAAPLKLIHCSGLSPMNLIGDDGASGPSASCGGTAPSGMTTKAFDNYSPWQGIADYPSGIMDSAVAEDPASGDVYSVGGISSGGGNTVYSYVYHPFADAWLQIADEPDPYLWDSAAAFTNGRLYLGFGWRASPTTPSTELYIYDPYADAWSAGSNGLTPEGGGVAAAVLDNKIYFIGGCGSSACGDTTVQVYDPRSDSWGYAAPYPHPVSWASCGAVLGKLYCAGGTAGATSYADGYAYDPLSNTWSAIAPLPIGSGGLWGSAYAGTPEGLVVSGGVTANSTAITNQGFVYEPESNAWSALPNAPESVYRAGSACGLYVIGGTLRDSSTPVSSAERLPGYDVCTTLSIPWLTLSPAGATLAAGAATDVHLTFDGTGESEDTTSQAYLVLTGQTPGVPQEVPLTVHWDPQPVDLALSASANHSSVSKGATVSYALKVSNLNEANHGAATAVTVTATFPNGVSNVTASGVGSCTASGSAYTCNLGTLVLGASETETVNATMSGAGTVTGRFSVSAREPDSDASNNSAAVTVSVTSSSGGGGSANWACLLLLAALVLLRAITTGSRRRRGHRRLTSTVPALVGTRAKHFSNETHTERTAPQHNDSFASSSRNLQQ